MSDAQTLALIEALERRVAHLEILEDVPGSFFGAMDVPAVDIEVIMVGVDPIEVKNAAGNGWEGGELNGVTFPTGGDEHYLTIMEPGRYEIIWNMSFHADKAGAQAIHGGVIVDDVAIRNNGEAHRDVANANDSGNIAAPSIIDLPNGTEEISLWISNDAQNDVHVEHATVTIKRIGTVG